MGYTHYWTKREEIPADLFKAWMEDVRSLVPRLEESGVRLAGPNGVGEPRWGFEEVAFNGIESCGHVREDLGIAWPAPGAEGVKAWGEPGAPWYAGLTLAARRCGGDCSHESFVMTKEASDFDFCKTAYKPYDLAVTAALILAKHHWGERISVRSDGGPDDWADARMLCSRVLGIGETFELDTEQ